MFAEVFSEAEIKVVAVTIIYVNTKKTVEETVTVSIGLGGNVSTVGGVALLLKVIWLEALKMSVVNGKLATALEKAETDLVFQE
jgi:hypothetical protein